ncbi:MAG: DcuS/MalK family sensor histidine kinase [Bacillota bacterium]
MKFSKMKLQTQITIIISLVIFISISFVALFMVKWTVKNVQEKVETNIMNTAMTVANAPYLRQEMERRDPDRIIQTYVESMLGSLKEIHIIVVADMQGIRYAHPNPQRIGEKFVGGDENRVIETGESYISEATGTLGKSLRAFVPIYGTRGQQIGFVMAAEMTESIERAKRQGIQAVFTSSLIALFLGMMGAFLLARNIKNALLGLEPDEITKLYIQKKALLEAMHEGIIAIDEQQEIILINDSAVEILDLKYKKEEIMGKDIQDIFPTSKLGEVFASGEAQYDREQVINNTFIVTNRVPVKNGDKIVGAIATFRDKTMVTKLAEEMTGVKQIIEALRANTHEFMNKLHVILGLIQVGDLSEAKKYILNVTDEQQQILSKIMNKIKDATIAGLLLGKISRAKEMGVQMSIDGRTCLERQQGKVNSSVLITIIGNFIENALEAVSGNNWEEKKVIVRIEETKDSIEIEVQDTGIGIKSEEMEHIFERGYSTKPGDRGVGLALVKETVENLKGSIKVASEVGKGTTVTAVLPKEERYD